MNYKKRKPFEIRYHSRGRQHCAKISSHWFTMVMTSEENYYDYCNFPTRISRDWITMTTLCFQMRIQRQPLLIIGHIPNQRIPQNNHSTLRQHHSTPQQHHSTPQQHHSTQLIHRQHHLILRVYFVGMVSFL